MQRSTPHDTAEHLPRTDRNLEMTARPYSSAYLSTPECSTRQLCGQTPCGGHTTAQGRARPLTGLRGVFAQLIGKPLFGQDFASELLCVPTSMPNPAEGTNHLVFSFSFFFFFTSLKGIQPPHPTLSVLGQRRSYVWAQRDSDSDRVNGLDGSEGRANYSPRGSRSGSRDPFFDGQRP